MEYLIQKYVGWVESKVKAIVIIQFFGTLALAWIPVAYWGSFYPVISNCIGYSLLSNSVLLLYIWNKPHCYGMFYRAMVVSLIVSNFFSCIALLVTYEFYTAVFDRYFTAAFAVLFYLYFKNQLKKSNL